MAYAAAYTDLVAVGDVLEGALAEGNEIGNINLVPFISGVTSDIETYLRRKLICRPWSEHVTSGLWDPDFESPDGYPFSYYPRHWPVIEVTAPTSGIVFGTAEAGGQPLYVDTPWAGTLTGFYGYRRHDQSLSDLQGESGLSTLTATPDVLPYTIHVVAVEIVLYRVWKRRRGTYDVSAQINVGGTIANVQGNPGFVTVDKGWEQRQLSRLAVFKDKGLGVS